MSIQAKSVRKIPGGVTIRDYRGTGLCPPNGGRIRPLIFVQHIPVIRNKPGTEDLITLGRVLKQQGLAVQAGTDAEGNVAQYTRLDELCYHARGANSVSMGCEHMHYSISEEWTEAQMRAAAWLAHHASVSYGIPLQRAILGQGRPTKVQRRGHTSHANQSAKAGFNDRSDPGPKFNYTHLYDLAKFYAKNRRF